jgi:hypothetical protein
MWPTHRPSLECYTLQGDRFYTVADDPKGDTVIDLSDDNDPARLNAQFVQLHATLQMMSAKLSELGVEVTVPDLNSQIPRILPSDDPNRRGSLGAPIVLGPDSGIDSDSDDVEDDLVPNDDGGIRKVVEVPVDDSKRIVRISN